MHVIFESTHFCKSAFYFDYRSLSLYPYFNLHNYLLFQVRLGIGFLMYFIFNIFLFYKFSSSGIMYMKVYLKT